MRESNFHFPSTNKACVSITSALYDRRALDCTADLPLVNSLSHLNYLTTSSARIREILTTDGGLERLVRILRTTCVTEDTLHNWKWTMAFQCVVNVGVRGTAEIRQRVVQVGAVPILVEILHAYLLGIDVMRLEQKVSEAMSALSERMNISKVMDYATLPDATAADDHAEINDPSNTLVSTHILASGANNSTGSAPPRITSVAAARSNAQVAAAAAAAAATGGNPIPVAVPPMHPPAAGAPSTANRQQTRRVGEGMHPLSRHVNYSDVAGPAGGSAISGSQVPYSSHAYLYSEQERLQSEYEAARRRLQAINHVMYRHDDVVLTLQLLAYLTKTPSQRQLFHECPLLSSQTRAVSDCDDGGSGGSGTACGVSGGYATVNDLEDAVLAAQFSAQANAVAGIPAPRRRKYANEANVDVFSIVERFTVQRAFPSDMVYWSSIVMRNSCRRDEGRNNCRQCAYLKCQKWEVHPNEFAKCRRCRKAKYCSKLCQSKAWQEGHRNWCTERNPSTANNPGVVEDEPTVTNAAAAAAVAAAAAAAMAGAVTPHPPNHQTQQMRPQNPAHAHFQQQQHQHEQHHQQPQQQYSQYNYQQQHQPQHQQQYQYPLQAQAQAQPQHQAGQAAPGPGMPPASFSTEGQGRPGFAGNATHGFSAPAQFAAAHGASGGALQQHSQSQAQAHNQMQMQMQNSSVLSTADNRQAAGGPVPSSHHGNARHHHPYRPPPPTADGSQPIAARSSGRTRSSNQ
ncbi:hypothetical protein FB645_004851 [Coemansia sp. IMI 203386]|nr:hypothetical protein FB645_004851 [Coemansia sp. IMI 203386]